MKIVVMSQNYPPDLGAGAFRIKALVNELIKRKNEVTVLTATPNRYKEMNEYKKEKPIEEVIRVKIPQQDGKLIKRAFGYLLYYIKIKKAAYYYCKDADLIVATTPQLLVAKASLDISRKLKIPFLVDIRDLWPETMEGLGITTKSSIIFKTLSKIANKIYKGADSIVINSPGFLSRVKRSANAPIRIITNGIDDEYYKKIIESEDLSNKNEVPIVTYAGNLGLCQDLEVLLKAAYNFKGEMKFILIGSGSDKNKLIRMKKNLKLDNVGFINPVGRKELANYYSLSNGFFVHLKNSSVFDTVIPSKIFEYIATGKPVIFGLGKTSTEIMKELQGNIYSFEQGNEKSLNKALKEFKQNYKQFNNDGGIKILEKKYLRSTLSKKFADVIEETVN